MQLFEEIRTAAEFISASRQGWTKLTRLRVQYTFNTKAIWAARILDLSLTIWLVIAAVHYLLNQDALWSGLLLILLLLVTGILLPYILFKFLLLSKMIRPHLATDKIYNTHDASRIIHEYLKQRGVASLSRSDVFNLLQEAITEESDTQNPSEQLMKIAKSKGIRGKKLIALYDGETAYLESIGVINKDSQ